MHARGVVETLDVRKHAATRCFSRFEASTVRLLDFQAVLEAPSAHCSAKLAISAAFRKNRYRFDATKSAFKSEQKTNEINTLHRRLHDHIEMQTVAFCTENKTTSRQCGAQPL